MRKNVFWQVLKIAPFRSLWLAQLLSQLFLNALFFSLILRVYELTHSNSAVSLMVLVFMIPSVVLSAFAGVLVDRWDRKIVMFFSHFLRIFIVLAFLASGETLAWIYLLTFVISTITQFFGPAEGGTIPELVTDKELLVVANSIFSVTYFGTVVAGNVLAGPLLRLLGPTGMLLLTAMAFLVASIFTGRLPGTKILAWRPNKYVVKEEEVGHFFSDFLIGLDHIYHHPKVARVIMILAVTQSTVGILGTIGPGYADKVLKIAVTDTSLFLMAPAAAGMIIGGLLIGQYLRKIEPGKLVTWGFLAVGLLLMATSLVNTVGLAVPFLVLLGVSNSLVDIPANTIVQSNSPNGVRSRVYGVMYAVIGIAGLVPIALTGALADQFGVQATVFLVAVALLVLAVYNKAQDLEKLG